MNAVTLKEQVLINTKKKTCQASNDSTKSLVCKRFWICYIFSDQKITAKGGAIFIKNYDICIHFLLGKAVQRVKQVNKPKLLFRV